MTANIHSVQKIPAFSVRRFARTTPLAVTVLVWLFAATMETGYVAVLDSGIQHGDQVRETV